LGRGTARRVLVIPFFILYILQILSKKGVLDRMYRINGITWGREGKRMS